jgi:hypothetical protein
MTPNRIFFNFLNIVSPEQANKFRRWKHGEGYETYQSVFKSGHKFIYDTKRQVIKHIYYVAELVEDRYEKKLITQEVKVIPTKDGFKTVHCKGS